MDAHKGTIYDICNGAKVLEVPYFQRSYVWDEPQWKRFLEDVENVSKTKAQYFMGSFILKQKETPSINGPGDIRTVIDGQQRLTTFSIFLKVLSLKQNDMEEFNKHFRLSKKFGKELVIRHNRNDSKAYNQIMALDTLKPVDGGDRISAAYRYFEKHVNAEQMDFDTICGSIFFVYIDLDKDEDEQQIFDTVNSLGVPLTTAELLKNYFFDRNNEQDYEQYWRAVFEKDEDTRAYWDQEITAGRLKRTFIDLFFFSWIQIKIQDSTLKVSTEDKLAFSRVEALFDSYKHFIRKYLKDQKEAVIQEIQEYALLFQSAINTSVLDREIPAKAGIERLNVIMFALETTTLIPYVLFVERNVKDAETKNGIYACLESYIMRRLLTRQTTKNYNLLFTDRLIFNRILSRGDLEDYLKKQDDKVNRLPSDGEVRAAFHESWLINKQAAGVLYLIESKIHSPVNSTGLLGIKKYSLEHLMPKKWINHWNNPPLSPTDATERDRLLLTLGNLAIITQALNASVRDADWNTKKSGKDGHGGLKKYAAGIETLSDYLNLDTWNEESIRQRADDLADKALEVWAI